MASAVPPMGSTQARLNLLGRKPHWGKYLDYDVSNDPNLNTTVLGATLSKPIFFLGSGQFEQYCWSTRKALFSSEFVERDAFQPFLSTMGVGRSFARDSTPLRQSREQPNHLV